MSNEINDLKQAEKESLNNWQWANDVEPQSLKEAPASNAGDDEGIHPSAKYMPFIFVAIGVIVIMAMNGITIPAAIGRFWWLVFFLPIWGGGRDNRMWMIPAFFIMLSFVGPAIWGFWWLIFLVPMFMYKGGSCNTQKA